MYFSFIKVTLKYPQGIIFTLLLNSQSSSFRRKSSAIHLIDQLKLQNAAFVEQAETISTEIQRVAILQQEEW